MPHQRITEFAMGHLGDIFVPEGLPLVDKTGQGATTSALIQGLAGLGKSTMAIALGEAIARARAGRLLYVTPEISPADFRAKLELLAIDRKARFLGPDERIDDAGEELLGTVLELTGDDFDLAAALEEVWTRVGASQTLRAVVVDAAVLLDHKLDAKTRRAVMDFIHAGEGRGVSSIFVEETAEEGTAASFLVDVVLVGVRADGGQGFRRSWVCTKSRYSRVIHGPHGVVEGTVRPEISVDLFQQIVDAGRYRVPEAWRGYVPTGVGLAYGNSNEKGLEATTLQSAFGLQSLSLSIGALTRIRGGDTELTISSSFGLNAVFDAAVRLAHDHKLQVFDIADGRGEGLSRTEVEVARRIETALVEAGFVMAGPGRSKSVSRPPTAVPAVHLLERGIELDGDAWLLLHHPGWAGPLGSNPVQRHRAVSAAPDFRIESIELEGLQTRVNGGYRLWGRLREGTLMGPGWSGHPPSEPGSAAALLLADRLAIALASQDPDGLRWLTGWWLPRRPGGDEAMGWPLDPYRIWDLSSSVARSLVRAGLHASAVVEWLGSRLTREEPQTGSARHLRLQRVALEAEFVVLGTGRAELEALAGPSGGLTAAERAEIAFNLLRADQLRGAVGAGESRQRLDAILALNPVLARARQSLDSRPESPEAAG